MRRWWRWGGDLSEFYSTLPHIGTGGIKLCPWYGGAHNFQSGLPPPQRTFSGTACVILYGGTLIEMQTISKTNYDAKLGSVWFFLKLAVGLYKAWSIWFW